MDEPRFAGLNDMIQIRLHLLAEEIHAVKVNENSIRSTNRVRNVLSKILVRFSYHYHHLLLLSLSTFSMYPFK